MSKLVKCPVRTLFPPQLAVMFLAVLLLTSCATGTKRDGMLEGWDPEFAQFVGPRYSKLPLPERRAFYYLVFAFEVELDLKHEANLDFFYTQLFTVLASPVVERPEYWVTMINDKERSELFRWYCIEAFLLRHLKPGDELAKLTRTPGTEAWFDKDTVGPAGALQHIPLERRPGEYDFVYTPAAVHPVGKKAGRWVFLTVKDSLSGGEIGIEDVLNVLRGEGTRRRLVVTGVAL